MSATRRIAFLAALMAVALLVGCTSAGTTDTPAGGATTGGEAAPGVEEPTNAAGQALVEKQCTMCHSMDRINGAVYDKEAWTTTVERMVTNGLVITDEDKQTIIDYLAERDASR